MLDTRLAYNGIRAVAILSRMGICLPIKSPGIPNEPNLLTYSAHCGLFGDILVMASYNFRSSIMEAVFFNASAQEQTTKDTIAFESSSPRIQQLLEDLSFS
ncbi:hypothetical protein KIN20_025349 [Parelaphostrongylus tenuis]|uniref:Uncharacterized protein n=1 Tax=Parelaphostrongylus tenuis TaxID=148309 RepID=A0AAD5N968_PARTN|nr:hypothetical protein KIN20_025349 [Parelaphostrongylus tenuis]